MLLMLRIWLHIQKHIRKRQRLSKKTKKCMASRPVSAEIMVELSKYVCKLNVGQKKLFRRKFPYRTWRKICKKAGLTDLKFHDLRKTFCSLLAQKGVSTAATQRLLEHSSPNLTNKIYTNVDPVIEKYSRAIARLQVAIELHYLL